MRKKAIGMSFNWIFAIIVGGIILFFAIFTASKIIGTGEKTVFTESAARFISLFDPLETGLASGKSMEIGFRNKVKTYYQCDSVLNPPFGKNYISFSQETLGREEAEEGYRITVVDKYVFAENEVQGNNYYIFSVPFFMPFKVSDLVIVTAGDYCFYDSPDIIQDELQRLNINNVHFVNSSEDCDGISVCFKSGNCDIDISLTGSYVKKNSETLYFIGDLLYAAIFSSPEIYECNVRRLKSRHNELAKIYIEKIDILKRVNCESKIGPKLSRTIGDIESSRDLIYLLDEIEDIDSINEAAVTGCQLY
ncbi:hypothetical protein GF386_00150 [Candidatus Pacearchaeota archaeon]|nr:hypothetical protein [Candidatus Pacearchaeota archaeon]MBD3282693.1 hypothetical protein [Candidatus Pacearchaeota archaeon]